MALIKADGFDLYAGGQSILARWPVALGGNGVGTTIGRFGGGGYAIEITGGGDSDYFGENFPEENTIGAGGALNLDPTGSYSGKPLIMFRRNGGGSDQLSVHLNSNTSIEIRRGGGTGDQGGIPGTLLATTAAGIISINVWHWIEFKATCRTGVNGSAEVRLNGVTILSITGVNTANSGVDGIDQVRFGSGASGSTTDNRWDDCIIWDTTGSVNNDFFGDTRIETLRPDGDTAQIDFTPDSGVTNWTQIDDATQDGDSTYVESAIPGDQDLYTTSDITGAPITFKAIQLVTYARKTDAGPGSISTVISEGTTITVNTPQVVVTSFTFLNDIHEINPDTSAAWTQTEIDGMEIGIEVG